MPVKKKKTSKKSSKAKKAPKRSIARKSPQKKARTAKKNPTLGRKVTKKSPTKRTAAPKNRPAEAASPENEIQDVRPSIPVEPDGTVLTLHPAGKQGTRITFEKYEEMRNIIRKILSRGEMTFMELLHSAEKELAGNFEGSISWYATTVKLDLEARGEIICERGRGEQMLRLP